MLKVGMDSANLNLLEELYEKYQEAPNDLDSSWAQFFSNLEPSNVLSQVAGDLKVYNLIEAYRKYGHLLANINPIAVHPPVEPWQLKLETLGFTTKDLNQSFPTYGLLESNMATLKEIIDALKKIYCGTIGVEFQEDPQIALWLQEKMESRQHDLSIEQKKMILHQLNRSELLESFIHTKYTSRFAIT